LNKIIRAFIVARIAGDELVSSCRSSIADENAGKRSWRLLATRLALFAILIQAFVVQTHVHFDANWTALAHWGDIATAAPEISDPADLTQGADPDRCLICHEQLAGGRTIVLDAIHLAPPGTAIFMGLYAEALSATYGIVSHSWHGRGPPQV
jgi:hypothetical protein